MCRLSAITTTNKKAALKRLVFHTMMIASQADDDQSYGCGVSDGKQLIKSGKPYLEVDGMEWISGLDPQRVWIGHVRKPSKGVAAADSKASHPYGFENNGNPFVAAHNGWVAGTAVHKAGDPDTDSWRAFTALEQKLNGADITYEAVQKWLGTFGAGSSYSFLFTQRDKLIGVAGHRPLHFMRWGDGVIINTSEFVLNAVASFLSQFERNDSVMYQFEPGTFFTFPDEEMVKIDLSTRPAPYELKITWFAKH